MKKISRTASRKVAPSQAATSPEEHLFGSHMSIAGGHENAVRAAAAIGFSSVQVFTKSSNQWAAKPLEEAGIAAFRQALMESGIRSPVAHASYLINLASPSADLLVKSIDSMTIEIERCAALGISDLVVHPGAHMGAGELAGLATVVRALDELTRRTSGLDVTIDLEVTAGQGSCLGHRLEHLTSLRAGVKTPERIGYCIDTCHLIAAGYELTPLDKYNQLMDELGRVLGYERIRVWHFNDSARERGSRVDRHAAIGDGHVGREAFERLVNDPRLRGRPLILETPKGLTADGKDWDAVNLASLRSMIGQEARQSTPAKPPTSPGVRKTR
jgi:deoxyribonuclease-4